MDTISLTFLSVVVVSLISLVGVFTLSLQDALLRKYVFVLVSVAIGALLGDAFFHLIPESFEELQGGSVGLLVLAGFFAFFLLEKYLHWHHHLNGEDEGKHASGIHPVGRLVLVSDGVHNFLDGVIIAASFMASPAVGIATTLAVILHEIPQEIGDFGVLIHAGYAKRRALLLNFFSALLAILGAVLALALGSVAESFIGWVVPVAAGGFIYIASTDLIPELHKSREHKNFAFEVLGIALGVLAMYLLLGLE